MYNEDLEWDSLAKNSNFQIPIFLQYDVEDL